MRIAVLLATLALFVAGCGPAAPAKGPAAAEAPKEPSTAQTMIDGVTGRTAVRQGKKAQETIEKVSAQKNADLEAVSQ